MRDYKKETDWDAKKYKRLTFKVDREQYDRLTDEQQKTLSARIRELIRKFLSRPK
jgi:ClpP class serine protease